MRILICLPVIVLVLANIACAEEKEVTAPESVVFDGQTLIFAFEGENPGETFKEFIPEGEALDKWTKFASLRKYPDVDDPLKFAQTMAELLKKTNPGAQSAIGKNEETGEVIIDFITWPDDQSFVEFNVFKLSKDEAGGVTAEQYAVRAYEERVKFLKGLKELREKLVPMMANDGLLVQSADAAPN